MGRKGSVSLIAIAFLALLVACAGEAEPTPPPATYSLDEASGLPLNPYPPPSQGEFIVQGEVISVGIAGGILLKVGVGEVVYQISFPRDAPVVFTSGEAVPLHELQRGLTVRATTWQGDATGLLGEPAYSGSDIVVLFNPGAP